MTILPNADEDVKKLDLPHITGGNVKWHSQSGEQCDGVLKK